jgi:hypothetical protein
MLGSHSRGAVLALAAVIILLAASARTVEARGGRALKNHHGRHLQET